jgi:hypothetical protein
MKKIIGLVVGLAILVILVFALVSFKVPILRDNIYLSQIDKIDNPEAVDITYNDLVIFLENLRTPRPDLTEEQRDRLVAVNNESHCADDTQSLHNEAEGDGIRAAVVIVYNGSWRQPIRFHSFNAFRTTDRGIVYVDSSHYNFQLSTKEYAIAVASEFADVIIAKWGNEFKGGSSELGKERSFWVCW